MDRMTTPEIIVAQETERQRLLDLILESTANKKLIVAGPGTGKTYTFRVLLEKKGGGRNLVLTFIRKLRDDMITALSEHAEVKTFHQYCKKILHEQNGRVDLFQWLTQVIQKDARVLKLPYKDFETKFRTLDHKGGDIDFYLARGDYYDSVCFDDSVYRLYTQLKANPAIVGDFEHILVDEFQDFNPLEVAFIDILESRGPVVIVGDDDQAIYDKRSSSPVFVRDKFVSGRYQTFDLPFCIRCPQPIVDAANSLIREGQKYGYLKDRIDKRFECFLGQKLEDSQKYPKIFSIRCTMAKVVPEYIKPWINAIAPEEISESWKQGSEYPTVLIIGPRHYLSQIEEGLKDDFPQLAYEYQEEAELGPTQGYKELLRVENSNLGWRLLAEFLLESKTFASAVEGSTKGKSFVSLLPSNFVKEHTRVVEIIRTLQDKEGIPPEAQAELESLIGDLTGGVASAYLKKKEALPGPIDKTKPSILMTSFNGCKGLSGGHVFIVGASNGIIPKNINDIHDIEFSRFLVALTRTRKRCHIVSSKWFDKAKDSNGKWLPVLERSLFTGFIDSALIEDFGDLNADQIRSVFR
jgi:superfamily I DNA/RNA helicase